MLAHPMAQRIEQWLLSRFIPYARNPRKNDHAIDRMAASIREFGFKVPVLARSTGDVIDNHLRLKGAGAGSHGDPGNHLR
jgi:ParB-like chromosome segregation protein Spo0J